MAKRFYTDVTTHTDEAGHFVRLDGRALKTPNKRPLRVPHADIAAAIAGEWDAVEVEGDIDPTVMPVTRLANVASEAGPRRADLVAEARAYAGTDLLSYRAPEPEEYVARQALAWDPWLSWGRERGVELGTTTGLLAIEQPKRSLVAVEEYADALDDFALTLFVHLVAVTGSAVLAMAVMEGDLEAGEAFDLSRMDEAYRAEIWGTDEDAEATAAALRMETATLGALTGVLR